MNTRRSPVRRLVAACALALLTTSPALARQMATWQGLAGWTAVPEIVGQTSTATVAGGGNPLYIPPVPQYSGAVGLRMDYGAGGAFVCSGSLIGPMTILTAAHCVSDGTDARPNSATWWKAASRAMGTVMVRDTWIMGSSGALRRSMPRAPRWRRPGR